MGVSSARTARSQCGFAALDGRLFRRRGRTVWAASWFHDGSALGPVKTGYGINWVVLAVIVRLPMLSRPVAVPVLAKLVTGMASPMGAALPRCCPVAFQALFPARPAVMARGKV